MKTWFRVLLLWSITRKAPRTDRLADLVIWAYEHEHPMLRKILVNFCDHIWVLTEEIHEDRYITLGRRKSRLSILLMDVLDSRRSNPMLKRLRQILVQDNPDREEVEEFVNRFQIRRTSF